MLMQSFLSFSLFPETPHVNHVYDQNRPKQFYLPEISNKNLNYSALKIKCLTLKIGTLPLGKHTNTPVILSQLKIGTNQHIEKLISMAFLEVFNTQEIQDQRKCRLESPPPPKKYVGLLTTP